MGRRNDRVAVLSTEGAIKKLVELAQAVGRQEACMHLTTIDAELLQKCAGGSIRDWLEWQSSDLQQLEAALKRLANSRKLKDAAQDRRRRHRSEGPKGSHHPCQGRRVIPYIFWVV